MNQWAFVLAAYAVAIGGTLAVVAISCLAMRKAEARSDTLRRER